MGVDPSDRRGHGLVAFWGGTWVGSMLLWLLLTSTVDPIEALLGAAVGAVAATAATVVRSKGTFLFRPGAAWLRLLVPLPRSIALDSWTVARALVFEATGSRPVRGRFEAMPFPVGRPEDAVAGARRAMATVAVSMSPNTVVVGFDPDSDEVLLHRLAVGGADTDALLPRT